MFFDRGVIEAVGFAAEVGAIPKSKIEASLRLYTFHPTVFVLPPWQAIYVTDSERDHTFDQAVNVHGKLFNWYIACGYKVHEVPCLPIGARVKIVLQSIANGA